jgi:hypothetical protein
MNSDERKTMAWKTKKMESEETAEKNNRRRKDRKLRSGSTIVQEYCGL